MKPTIHISNVTVTYNTATQHHQAIIKSKRSMNVFTKHPQYFSPSEFILADSGITATNLCVPLFTMPAQQSILSSQAAYINIVTIVN